MNGQSNFRPEKLSASTVHFAEMLGLMMECSMHMAGQTSNAETRIEMVSTMSSITSSSSYLLTKAKTVCQDPSGPQAQNSMVAAARGITESLNKMIIEFTTTLGSTYKL